MRKFKKLVSILVAVMVLISTLSVSLVIADKMIDNSTYKDLEIYDTTEFNDLEEVESGYRLWSVYTGQCQVLVDRGHFTL